MILFSGTLIMNSVIMGNPELLGEGSSCLRGGQLEIQSVTLSLCLCALLNVCAWKKL